MITVLRQHRKQRFKTLPEFQDALATEGVFRTRAYLSRLERGDFWPSRQVLDAVKTLLPDLTDDQILRAGDHIVDDKETTDAA